ncbi:hypothetical protein [Microbacterium hydrocarbonoxydans]|uniref:hypothetical protein n=1 Tax=Microbacterium hydrocarbonoxydans TaxID=273678 RepID=UPI003D9797AC
MSLAFQIAVEQYHAVRDQYEVVLIAAYERAVEETNGAMVNRRGQAKGISDWDLFTHNSLYAQAYASEELIEHWAKYPRPTFSNFERQMLG